MKRHLLLLLALILTLTACGASEPEPSFDEASEGIVSVILKDYNDGTVHYDTVGPNGQRQETQPFDSAPLEILTAAEDCFENSVEGQPPNRLVQISLLNESGQPAEITETHEHIFALAAQQEHLITKMRILRSGECHFVTIEWNVNFWDPHGLYYYNPSADQLIELYTYDATQVIGLKPLNLQNTSSPLD